jgi:hypothetical protein
MTENNRISKFTPLLREMGQKLAIALTDTDLQAFLARQESLAPATYNQRLATLRSFTIVLQALAPLDPLIRHAPFSTKPHPFR